MKKLALLTALITIATVGIRAIETTNTAFTGATAPVVFNTNNAAGTPQSYPATYTNTINFTNIIANGIYVRRYQLQGTNLLALYSDGSISTGDRTNHITFGGGSLTNVVATATNSVVMVVDGVTYAIAVKRLSP